MLSSDSAPVSAPDRLRVWLVGDFAASRSGNFSVAEELARRLEKRGFWVGSTSKQGHSLLRVLDMGYRTWRQASSLDVAVIDVYSGRAFVWAELVTGVLRRHGVPTVLVLRGGNLPAMALGSPARVRRLLVSAKTVVALSRYLGDHLTPYADDLRVIPNPIDASAYTFLHRTNATPRLLWLRAFEATYDPVLAVDVLALVRRQLPHATLVMVGPDRGDGTGARTRARARELGVMDAVEFVGAVSKQAVPAQLQRGDILLNTPRIDNVPISVLEAMATGLCVVSTDVGGLPYLLRDGHDALLVPAGDAVPMAAAVIRLCEDPELAGQLSQNARTTALSFDWSLVLSQWEDLLHEVGQQVVA